MKINKLIITIIAAAFIFMGCSNSLDTTPSATGRYSVTGKISFAGSSGAAPLILTKDSEGRTATTSFNNAHFSLNLYAYKYGQDGLDQSKKYDNVVVDQSGSFIFCFESKGEYVIYAELIKDEKTCGKGSAYVDVNSFTPKSVRINASPVITENGTIQLSVSTATDIDPQIKKVCVSWIDIYIRNIEDEATHDGTGHESSPAMQIRNSVLTEGEYNKSFDVVNGTTTISYDDFPGGSWLAKICFDDENGNTLYSCQEIINVYPGFITNLWYGTTPVITDGSFKVTKNMVTKYGTEVVPNFDKILLWDYYVHEEEYGNTEKTYYYYQVNEGDVGKTITSEPSVNTPLAMYAINDMQCFDSNGNLYVLSMGYGRGQNLVSTKENWQNPRTVLDDFNPDPDWPMLIEDVNEEYVRGFKIDISTDIAYLFYGYEGTSIIRKYPNLLTSNGTDTSFDSYELELNEDTLNSFFTIYNGQAYILRRNNEEQLGYFLEVYDLKNTESGEVVSSKKHYTVSVKNALHMSNIQNDAMITDMLYQDGAIYLLYKETGTYKSRGAVLRYNTATGYIDSLGLAGAIDNDSFTGVKVSTYVFDDPDNKPLYNDEACTSQWYVDADKAWHSDFYDIDMTLLPSIYSPDSFDSLSTNQFYGPSKFVAVKPKKLVIADDGIAFYADNDVLKYKNVNRVVTVDLEQFAIENTEDTSVIFDSDKSDMIKIGDTGTTEYQEGFVDAVDSSNKKYYENPSNPDDCPLTGVYGKSVIFGIPCGD